MDIDFLDAHDRHWRDAEQLFASTRLANADHLYGMAAECGLKHLMSAFGMPVTNDGDPTRQADRKHADNVWARYETYRSGQLQGASFTLPASNPFIGWNISQRYASQSRFDQNRVERHRDGAETVHDLIKKARKDGLI